MRGNRDTLILASGSPRRAQILKMAGIPFRSRAAGVDEKPCSGEKPAAYAVRLAREKAEAARRPGEVALGADTVVIVGKEALGKPRDARDAARMLRALSGRMHRVITGVCLLGEGWSRSEAVETRVWFRRLSGAEIAEYVASGEPLDKAGAYAIQGLASRFVERIEGCYFNVMGLPVSRVYEWLRDLR